MKIPADQNEVISFLLLVFFEKWPYKLYVFVANLLQLENDAVGMKPNYIWALLDKQL